MFFSSPAFGISLETCLEKAMDNSRLVKAYADKIHSDQWAMKKDQSSLWPHLALAGEADYLHFGSRADLPSGFEGSVGADLAWDLPRVVQDYPRLSRLAAEKSGWLARETGNDIRRQVSQDYYKLYVLLQRKPDYLQAEKYFTEHIRDIQRLEAAGVDVALDLTRARVQLKSILISLGDLNREIGSTLLSLNSRMNTAFTEENIVPLSIPDLETIRTDQAVFDETREPPESAASYIDRLETTYTRELDHLVLSRLAEMDARIAEEAFRQSRWTWFPTLNLGLVRNLDSRDPSLEEYRTYLGFNWDLLDFGQRANETQQLRYESEYQQEVYREARRQLQLHLDQLITEIENVQVTYRNAQENLSQAEKIIATAKTRYRQGKLKETDLLNIFAEYLNSKDQMFAALDVYLAKKAELEYYLEGMPK